MAKAYVQKSLGILQKLLHLFVKISPRLISRNSIDFVIAQMAFWRIVCNISLNRKLSSLQWYTHVYLFVTESMYFCGRQRDRNA